MANRQVTATANDLGPQIASKTDLAKPTIQQAHAEFVMGLAAHKPRPFPLEPHPEDFSARAVCCESLIEQVTAHLTTLVDEAADNDALGLIQDAGLVETIDAHLGDLKSDITGTLERVAERILEDRYEGCSPGPFYRRRRT